jgi:hypothetical protein
VRRRLAAAAVVAAVIGGVVAIAQAVLGPQPEEQARQDGCGRSRTAEFARLGPGWAYVGDAGYPASGPPPPARWLTGVVDANGSALLAAHPSGGDDPTTHDAFDFNINVLPDPKYADLLGGNPEEKNGNFEGTGEETGRIHIEREANVLPQFVWPNAGDRVAVFGSWVWDCGHWDPGGERTEVHPYRALWTERTPSPRSPTGESEGDLYVSTVATPAGQIAECAHKTKGNQAVYKQCTFTQPNWLDVSGDYDLTVPAPPRPPGTKRLIARVVNRRSTIPVVRPRIDTHGARLVFHLSATPGKRLVLAEEVFVGWSPSQPPVHLRVTFTRLLTRRSMDPKCSACPNAESKLGQQIVSPPGEWLVYSDVDGLWRLWPGVFRARDGSAFPLNLQQDLFVPSGRPWRLLLWTHECDFGSVSWTVPVNPMAPCPKSREFGNFVGDDVPGIGFARFGSPAASLGRHVLNGSTARPSTCPAKRNPRGCYSVTYVVTRVR